MLEALVPRVNLSKLDKGDPNSWKLLWSSKEAINHRNNLETPYLKELIQHFQKKGWTKELIALLHQQGIKIEDSKKPWEHRFCEGFVKALISHPDRFRSYNYLAGKDRF